MAKDPPTFDHRLVFTARRLQDGANVHGFNNVLCVYIGTFDHAEIYGWTEERRNLFRTSELKLRQLVSAENQKRFAFHE